MASQGRIIVKGVVCRCARRVAAVITPEMNVNHFFKTNKNILFVIALCIMLSSSSKKKKPKN